MTSCLTRRKPLRAVSAKKAERDAAWAETSKRILEERPACEARPLMLAILHGGTLTPAEEAAVARSLDRCTMRSREVHHVLQRSLGGADEDGNLLALCPSHHAWAHGEIDLATRVGLLVPSWEARR